MLLLVIVGGATASPVAASDGDRPLLPQDMNSTAVLTGEATTGEAAAPLCVDPVPGWKDSYKEDCKAYETAKYCTSDGGFGSGWTPSWGPFAGYAVKGIDATMACCACGANVHKLAPGAVVTTRTQKTPKWGKDATITGPSFTMGSDDAIQKRAIEALTPNSAAFGVGTLAKAFASFAAGEGTSAEGRASFAAGWLSSARGMYSFAAGRNTVAHALGSFASGEETSAFSFNSAAFGMYNTLPDNPKGKWPGSSKGKWVATDPIFQIGVGTSSILGKDSSGKDFPNVRADAFAVTKGGEVLIGKGCVPPFYAMSCEIYVKPDPAGKSGEVHMNKLRVGGKTVSEIAKAEIGDIAEAFVVKTSERDRHGRVTTGEVRIGPGCDIKGTCPIEVKPGELYIGHNEVHVQGNNVNIKGNNVNIQGELLVNGKKITASAMSSLMATPPDGTTTAALKAEVASLKEQLAAQGEKLSALEATVARLAAAK